MYISRWIAIFPIVLWLQIIDSLLCSSWIICHDTTEKLNSPRQTRSPCIWLQGKPSPQFNSYVFNAEFPSSVILLQDLIYPVTRQATSFVWTRSHSAEGPHSQSGMRGRNKKKRCRVLHFSSFWLVCAHVLVDTALTDVHSDRRGSRISIRERFIYQTFSLIRDLGYFEAKE